MKIILNFHFLQANIRFSCLQLSYGSLEDHFTKSNLNIYNNNWSSIHDFSPSMDRNNWTLNTTDVSALQGIIAAENSYPGLCHWVFSFSIS